MSEHLTDLELELVRTGEGGKDSVAHVESCSECRERLVFFNEIADEMAMPARQFQTPMDRDARILELIAERSTEIRRVRWSGKTMRWIVPLAAAASVAIVICAGLFLDLSIDGSTESPVVTAGPDDVNGDGTVNIVDALVLAQAIEAQGKAEDGERTPEDVDRIARRAVALGNGVGR